MTVVWAVFFISIFAIVYTFAGYPLTLAVWARIRPRPARPAAYQPRVVIVVAVHNGEALIARKIETCLAQDYPADRLRMLIVDDGSVDNTVAAIRPKSEPRVSLLALPARRGKAACLNDAVVACGEEIIVFTDARQMLNPQAVRHLVENFADPEVGAVSGQLVFVEEGMTEFGAGMDAYWRYEKFIRRMECRIHSTVGVTGALYALRRECYRPIPEQTILDDVLIPMNVVLQGRRVLFEDRAMAFDRPSRDAAQERVRKVRTLAGNYQLLSMFPALLSPRRNPIALQFISHKVMRLVAPLAMAAALLTNIMLARQGSFFMGALAFQVAGYAMAALGAVSPAARKLRLVKLALAFVSLNWFAMLGFIEFVSNPDAHLWKTHRVASDASRPSV